MSFETLTPIERIQEMERCYDTLRQAAAVDPRAIRKDFRLQEMFAALTAYYDGGLWLKDYERDERGELPCELQRGVLSQDGVYNLLAEIRQETGDGDHAQV